MRVTRTLAGWAGLCAAVFSVGEARGIGTITGGEPSAIEQRVALSIGPGRTTLWSQVRLDAHAGPVAIIVPARPGASVDWASDAWLESLDATTAPRLLPPVDATAACPGEPEPVDPVDVAGSLVHVPTLTPVTAPEVLADATAVEAWAQQHGMTVSGSLAATLSGMPTHRFVVARFAAPDGEVLTPTLRVSGPDAAPSLPLLLVESGDKAMRLTTFVIAEGRASLEGGAALSLDAIGTTYDAATGTTDYADVSAATLESAGPTSWLTERASHTIFTESLHAYRDHYVRALTTEYAERAASYAGDFDAATCLLQLQQALSQTAAVAASCPPAALGVVEGMNTCTETVPQGMLDPDTLRCGAVADDLAIALSELSPASAWVTRLSMHVAPHAVAADRLVTVGSGAKVDPMLAASQLDTSGCSDGSGGGGGAGGSEDVGGAGGGGPHIVPVPVREVDTSCGSREVGRQVDTADVYVDEYEEPPDAIYVEVECDGDTADSYAISYDDEYDSYEDQDDDSCSGDTTTSYETYETTYETAGTYDPSWSDDDSDDCGGDTTTSYETTETYEDWDPSDTSSSDDYVSDDSDGCGSDSSESYETSDWEDDDDSSSSSSDSCSGDSSESTTTDTEYWSSTSRKHTAKKRPRRKRKRIRLSKVTMSAAFFLFPLRRISRRRRRRKRR